MKRAILVNPVSGPLSPESKRKILEQLIEQFKLKCDIYGLETKSGKQFCALAKKLAREFDELWIAGGDGTVNEVLNSIDSDVVLAYIPLGTGCFMGYTLGYFSPKTLYTRGYFPGIVKQILKGEVHEWDLIQYGRKKKGLLASVGFDSQALCEKESYEKQIYKFLDTMPTPIRDTLKKVLKKTDIYAPVAAKSLFGGYKKVDAEINIDGNHLRVPKTSAIVVTKVPFFGRGVKVVPQAKLDDGLLHVFVSKNPIPALVIELVMTYIHYELKGMYHSGKKIDITTAEDMPIQIDGNIEMRGKHFSLEVLQGAARFRY